MSMRNCQVSSAAQPGRPFWALSHDTKAVALVCGVSRVAVSYGELAGLVEHFAERMLSPSGPRALGFIVACNDVSTVVGYLGAIRAGHALALLPATLNAGQMAYLLERYRPDWLLLPAGQAVPAAYSALAGEGGVLCRRLVPDPGLLHPELALLLSTSGSTGSPKMVRLSAAAVAANAQAIAEYLAIGPEERAITTLPISYAYGLSVLNSHLHAGATVLLTDEPVLGRPFWDFCRDRQATSLAGVSYTYQMLRRLRLDRMDLPALRTLTQAGGALDAATKAEFLQMAEARDWRFFCMYGQTEAVARIAYVPAERLSGKLDAIGIAIPGGALSLAPETGELIYRGPNVMMGYAEGRADLARGDDLGGVLHTGDLASVDADGYFSLYGRLKRIAKVFGHRLNLDEIERGLEIAFPAIRFAVVDGGDRLLVAAHGPLDPTAVAAVLRTSLGLHPTGFHLVQVDALPMTHNDKTDYRALAAIMGA